MLNPREREEGKREKDMNTFRRFFPYGYPCAICNKQTLIIKNIKV